MNSIKVTTLAVVAALSVSAVNAQQPIVKKQQDLHEMVVNAKKLPDNVAKQRVFSSYRLVNETAQNGTLTAGTQLYNDVTRQLGTVSGNVTVLAADGVKLAKVAQQFGLTVVTQESRVGLGVLSAPANADLIALVKQLKSSELVKSARLEVVEALNQPR